MLMDRIKAAFMFRQGVYAEVEHDVTFTQTAWMIVLVANFLSQLGVQASALSSQSGNFITFLVGVFVGTIIAVLAFAISAYAISYLGKSMFNAQVTFEEVVRTAGLASVWLGFGVIGILGPFLTCVFLPALILAVVLYALSLFIALQEALDIEAFQTIILVIIATVIHLIFRGIITAIF